jgi:hypothetical protein
MTNASDSTRIDIDATPEYRAAMERHREYMREQAEGTGWKKRALRIVPYAVSAAMLAIGALGGFYYRNEQAKQERQELEYRLFAAGERIKEKDKGFDYVNKESLNVIRDLRDKNDSLKKELERTKGDANHFRNSLHREQWDNTMKLRAKDLEKALGEHYQEVSAGWTEEGYIDPGLNPKKYWYKTLVTARANGIVWTYNHSSHRDENHNSSTVRLSVDKNGDGISIESRPDIEHSPTILDAFNIIAVIRKGKTYMVGISPEGEPAIPEEVLAWAKEQLKSNDIAGFLNTVNRIQRGY